LAAQERRVVVVGAGLAGLGAAWTLAQRRLTVSVLEREARPGGRAACVREQGFALEAISPLLWGADRALLAWIAAVGAGDEALPLRPVVRGQVHRGSVGSAEARGVLGVARIPGVRPHEALRLLRLPRLLARYGPRLDPEHPERAAALDDRSLAEFARLYFGPSVLERWMGPELCAEALCDAAEASRALFLRRLRERAGSRPGLPRAPLADVAEAAAGRLRVLHGSDASRVEMAPGGGLRVLYTAEGRARSVDADAVVLATPAPESARIAAGLLTAAERDALAGVRYAPALAVAVALRRPLGPHAELVRFPPVEGSPLGSALLEPGAGGGRAPDARGLAVLRASAAWSASARGLADETVEKELLDAFEGIRPGLRAAALFTRVLRVSRALPRFEVGRYRTLARLESLWAELRRGGRRLYVAGDYLVDPSWAGALASGRRVARAVAADLG
jgi:oxygen-dependent protoporphyrinogen oxidase